MELIDKINSFRCIFLEDLYISKVEADRLHILICQGGLKSHLEDVGIDRARYLLTFDYLHFAVTSEIHHRWTEDEVYQGGHIRVFTKSLYRDSVESTTGLKFAGTDQWYGDLSHYQIISGGSIIDIASLGSPQIDRQEGQKRTEKGSAQ